MTARKRMTDDDSTSHITKARLPMLREEPMRTLMIWLMFISLCVAVALVPLLVQVGILIVDLVQTGPGMGDNQLYSWSMWA